MHNTLGSKVWHIIVALLILYLAFLMIFNAGNVLNASLTGLNLWLWVVLPSLLPFFVTSEIMTETGLVDLISIPLHRIMRPLFRCPGQSSFVWIMSVTSGYPVGANLIAQLLTKQKITAGEAQRMLSFCSTSGPLFMIGAIGTGMLGSSQAGLIIAASHYIASLTTGLLFRFYRPKNENAMSYSYSTPSFKTAFKQFLTAYQRKKQSFGAIFGQAVTRSMNNLLVIGGFIMFFSVIIDLLISQGIIGFISATVEPIFSILGFTSGLAQGLSAGILEITVGSHMLSETSATISSKIMTISFIIGWSGLSIHSQIINILRNTQLSIRLYLISKLYHAIISSVFAWCLISIIPISIETSQIIQTYSWVCNLKDSLKLAVYGIISVLALSFTLGVIQYTLCKTKRTKI